MRRFAVLFLLSSLMALSACAEQKPPVGRWQGAYADNEVMIEARLEIAADGSVRVSAPNAYAEYQNLRANEREAIRAKLVSGLAQAWPAIETRHFDFDGKDFRKPGGVAPQLEWDSGAKKMTFIFYSGSHPSVRVAMNPVSAFD